MSTRLARQLARELDTQTVEGGQLRNAGLAGAFERAPALAPHHHHPPSTAAVDCHCLDGGSLSLPNVTCTLARPCLHIPLLI
jgi:hypothetical protein